MLDPRTQTPSSLLRYPDSFTSGRGGRALAVAGCSLAAAAVVGAAATPAAASHLAATPDFVHSGAAGFVPSPELLTSGGTGPAVEQLQYALGIRVSGVFGDATGQAVVRFQQSHRLQTDGVVGPDTRRALHLRVKITGAAPASPSSTTSTPASSLGSSVGTDGYSIPASIVMCESGGSYTAVNPSTGAGGAYQILPSTWAAYGGTGLPQNASPAEQGAIAARIYATAGPGQWSC